MKIAEFRRSVVYFLSAFILVSCGSLPKVSEGDVIRVAMTEAWKLDGKYAQWNMKDKIPLADKYNKTSPYAQKFPSIQKKVKDKVYWEVVFMSYIPIPEHLLVVFVDAKTGDILGHVID